MHREMRIAHGSGTKLAGVALGALIAPAAMLTVAAVLSLGLGLSGRRGGRAVVAVTAWLALLVLIALWLPGGRPLYEAAPSFSAGISRLRFRVDAVVVLFQIAVLLPSAVLLTFQRRSSYEAALAAVTAAAALGTLAGGSFLWTTAGLGLCASLALITLRCEDPQLSVRFWAGQIAAWLLLTWTAVQLDKSGGTSVYGAIPVTALRLAPFGLLAAGSLAYSGLLPWRSWTSEIWTRRRLEAGSLSVGILVPLGIYPLVRAYGMGSGLWPSTAANAVMVALGALVAIAAAVRAQAAQTRPAFLAEAVPMAGGMTLLALSVGTPLGVVAGLVCVIALALLAGLAPLVREGRGAVPTLSLALMVGVPPALVFGSWLFAIQAAMESGSDIAFLAIAAAIAWLLMLAAAARALRLPEASGQEPSGSIPGAIAVSTAGVLLGLALTGVIALLAIPAAAEVMPAPGGGGGGAVSQAAILGPGGLSIATTSGGWSPVLLGGSALLLALAATGAGYLVMRRRAGIRELLTETGMRVVALKRAPAPLFELPAPPGGWRAAELLKKLRLSQEYGSLFRPAHLELAVARSRPWLWATATVVLALAVTR